MTPSDETVRAALHDIGVSHTAMNQFPDTLFCVYRTAYAAGMERAAGIADAGAESHAFVGDNRAAIACEQLADSIRSAAKGDM